MPGWIPQLLAAAVAVMTLLPLVRRDAWWIRACEFPRVQILALALAVLAALPWTGESAGTTWLLAAAAGGSALLRPPARRRRPS